MTTLPTAHFEIVVSAMAHILQSTVSWITALVTILLLAAISTSTSSDLFQNGGVHAPVAASVPQSCNDALRGRGGAVSYGRPRIR